MFIRSLKKVEQRLNLKNNNSRWNIWYLALHKSSAFCIFHISCLPPSSVLVLKTLLILSLHIKVYYTFHSICTFWQFIFSSHELWKASKAISSISILEISQLQIRQVCQGVSVSNWLKQLLWLIIIISFFLVWSCLIENCYLFLNLVVLNYIGIPL